MAATTRPFSRRFGTARRDPATGNLLEGEYNERGMEITPPTAPGVGSDDRGLRSSLPNNGRGYSPKGSVFNQAFPNPPSGNAGGTLPVADARNAVAAGRLKMGLPTLESVETGSRIASAAGTGNAVQTPYGTVSSAPIRPLTSYVGTPGKERLGPSMTTGAQMGPPKPLDDRSKAALSLTKADTGIMTDVRAQRPLTSAAPPATRDPLEATPPAALPVNNRLVMNPMAGDYQTRTDALPSRSSNLNLTGVASTMAATAPRAALPRPLASNVQMQNGLPVAMESSQSGDPRVRAGAPGLTAWERNMEGDMLSPRNILRAIRRPRQTATPLQDRIVGSY